MSEDDDERGGDDRLHERLRAVERALTGGDHAVADLEPAAEAADERDRLEERIADLEARVEELEAATQAVRGYVGSIRAVNREVERRADLALAAATEARAGESTGARADGSTGARADGSTGARAEMTTDGDGSDEARDPIDDPAIAAALPGDRTERDATGDAIGTNDVNDAAAGNGANGATAVNDATVAPDDEGGSVGRSTGSAALDRLREVL